MDQLRALPLAVVCATDDAVFTAAGLKMRYAISYADAFAAATADGLSAVLVTGDPEREQLESRVRIEKLERGERAWPRRVDRGRCIDVREYRSHLLLPTSAWQLLGLAPLAA